MKIILTGKPISTNSLYATMCKGNFPTRYMTTKGKNLKESYQWEAKSQWKSKPIDTPVSLQIDVYHDNKRKNDIDNFNKILFDSLTGIVWVDDSQIQEITVRKRYDKERPRVELEINKVL